MLGLLELLSAAALREGATAVLSSIAAGEKPGGRSCADEGAAEGVTGLAVLAAPDKWPSWLGALSEGFKDLADAEKPGGRSAPSWRLATPSCCG